MQLHDQYVSQKNVLIINIDAFITSKIVTRCIVSWVI